jgi:hypothetical protein
LRAVGLPSQLDHPCATNTPHVTVLAAPVLPADDRAAALLGPLLPIRVRATGLLLLGGARVTLARAVAVDDAVVAAVLALTDGVPDLPHRGWLPHVTSAGGCRARRSVAPARSSAGRRRAGAHRAAPVGPRAGDGHHRRAARLSCLTP